MAATAPAAGTGERESPAKGQPVPPSRELRSLWGWVHSPAPLPWGRTANGGLEEIAFILLIRNSGACEIALDRQDEAGE